MGLTPISEVLQVTRRSRLAVVLFSALLVLIVAVVAYRYYAAQRTEALADQLILEAAAGLEEVPPFTSADAAALRQFPNRVHVERAQELGIPRIPDREAAERMLQSDNMVELQETRYYTLLDLGYSVPYVTVDAARLLEIIGERFQQRLRDAGLPIYRFIVTSATRTDDDQRRLRQVNANAAANSSHFHGTTVDIHYARWNYDVRFDTLPSARGLLRPVLEDRLQNGFSAMIEDHHPKLKSVMADVMREVQDEELVMVTYERMQPVYHITVNQRIDEETVAAAAEGEAFTDGDDAVAVVAPAR